MWCCEGFGGNGVVQNCLYVISEGCVLSKNKGIILKLTLEISAGHVKWIHLAVYTDIQMAPLYRTERCFPSVILKLLHRQFFHNLNNAAAHYYRQYYTGPSEHYAVAVWPGADIRRRQTSVVLLSVA